MKGSPKVVREDISGLGWDATILGLFSRFRTLEYTGTRGLRREFRGIWGSDILGAFQVRARDVPCIEFRVSDGGFSAKGL